MNKNKESNTKFYLYYILPIIIYCAGIFYLSSQTIIPGPAGTQLINDKIKHAILYLGLSILTYRAAVQTKFRKYAYVVAILFTTIYGITDELHQSFVPGRIYSIADMIANAIGASLILINKRKKGKRAHR